MTIFKLHLKNCAAIFVWYVIVGILVLVSMIVQLSTWMVFSRHVTIEDASNFLPTCNSEGDISPLCQ
jgi:hypothetical protein